MSRTPKQRIVVVGAGYAGTLAAIRIAARGRSRVAVTLVNPSERFVQRLRLHQVAAGQEVAQPLLRKLVGRRVEVVQGAVVDLDLDRDRVVVDGPEPRELTFDRLVWAVGSNVDVGAPGAAEHAHALAGVDAARRLWSAVERLPEGAAVRVVGGGMTGIEAASELAAARPDVRTSIVTRGQLGHWLSPGAREHLAAAMRRLDVEVVEDTAVAAVGARALELDDGSALPSDVTVWCGGFRAPALAREAGLLTGEEGRLVLDASLRSVSHPQVVGAGDAAAPPALASGTPVRMCCQAAMPAAAHAADVVVAEARGREPKRFDFGFVHQPISLGRRDGVVQFVDRGDAPRARILTGRKAAVYKEIVSGSAITGMRMERMLPGATRWPFRDTTAETAPEALPAG